MSASMEIVNAALYSKGSHARRESAHGVGT